MNKKSILAETLADIQEIKEGMERNANHVLKSTLKEDLEEIVRKGLNESEDDDLTQTDDMADDISADQESGEEGSEEMTDGGAEEFGSNDAETDDLDIDTEVEPGEPEVIDLTDKTDDEVIQHFNLMKPADEIEIIQTPDKGIQINIKSTEENEPEIGDEFSDEIGGEELPGEDGGEEFGGEPEDEPVEEPEHNSDDEESDDEEDGSLDEYGEENENKPQIYKIEISDGGDEEHGVGDNTTSMKKSEKHMKDVPVKEDVKHVNSKSHLKHANPQSNLKTEELQESLVKTRKKIQSLMAENKQKTNELSEMTNLVKTFKKQEAEYKSAIKNLKGTLQEAALFTSNLSYIVKLLSENTTTKDEKLSIIKRFDSAKTLNESTEVFNSLETLLNESKKTPEKVFEEQVLKTPKTSGSSKINESTAYKNPQITRMMELIGKM